MYKILSVIICILIIGIILSACDSSTVTITVNSKYENTLADELASEKTIDNDGNTVYTFTKPKYVEYLEKLMEKIRSEFRGVISANATYSYLNEDGTELVVGVDKAIFDETECKEQAQQIGNLALMYNASTLQHTGKVSVIYENCYTGEEFFKSEVTSSQT